MLAHMVEQAQGKTTLIEEIEVEVAVLQLRNEIIVWMAKINHVYTLLTIKIQAVRDDDNSIERATIEAVRKNLPKPSWQHSVIIRSSSMADDRPLVCLTITHDSSLEGIEGRFEPRSVRAIVAEYNVMKTERRRSKDKEGIEGAALVISWLKTRSKSEERFAEKLLMSKKRIFTSCVHNPALARQNCSLRREPARDKSTESKISAEKAAAKLKSVFPAPIIFFNPLFNTEYGYAGRKEAGELRYLRDGQMEEGGSGVRYEVHSAAKKNEGKNIESLFSAGYDLNLLDETGWAPIHYAAFYGNLKALNSLINCGCNVNITNSSGSSAVHLAVKGLQDYVLELLLLHPKIDRFIRDHDGYTPFDLGRHRKKNAVGEELGRLIYLLQYLEESPKILVTLPNGTTDMIKPDENKEMSAFKRSTRLKDTTAAQLLYEVLTKDKAMNASPELARELINFFAIFIVDGDRAIQLDGSELPARVADWESDRRGGKAVEVCVRRNQLVGVTQEKQFRLNETSNEMLVNEIEKNFRDGWLEVKREDVIYMTVCLPSPNSRASDTLERLPKKYRDEAKSSPEERSRLLKEIETAYANLDRKLTFKKRNELFLAKARKYVTYGCLPYPCKVVYILPAADPCHYLGANEDGIHVYKKTKDLFCSYSWDNLRFSSAKLPNGSIEMHFDQFSKEVIFSAATNDELIAGSILRLCEHYTERNRLYLK